MNRRLTSAALAAAAALTLSLASPIAAHADESATLGRSAAAGTAAPSAASPAAVSPAAVSAANPVEISKITLTRGYGSDHQIRSGSYVFSNVNIAVAVDPSFSLYRLEADICNGARKETLYSIGYQSGTRSISWGRTLGAGSTRICAVRAIGYQGGEKTLAIAGVSNTIAVKRVIDYGYGSLTKSGKKLTIKAKSWRTYEANGSKKSVGKVKLQRLYKGKWRNYKNIKVNKSGNGKIVFKQKKKFKYRLVHPGSSTIVKYVTGASRKI